LGGLSGFLSARGWLFPNSGNAQLLLSSTPTAASELRQRVFETSSRSFTRNRQHRPRVLPRDSRFQTTQMTTSHSLKQVILARTEPRSDDALIFPISSSLRSRRSWLLKNSNPTFHSILLHLKKKKKKTGIFPESILRENDTHAFLHT
jgi:hypothetical protein